jgi:hypothetical protein
MLNQKGQAFVPFRLLIAVIMAGAVLVIIVGIVAHFDEQKIAISEKRLYEGFQSAVQSPNGDIIVRTEIVFKPGATFTASGFARRAKNIETECVLSLEAPDTPSISNPSIKSVVFKQGTTTSAFFRCERTFSSICDIECEISIGEPFR